MNRLQKTEENKRNDSALSSVQFLKKRLASSLRLRFATDYMLHSDACRRSETHTHQDISMVRVENGNSEGNAMNQSQRQISFKHRTRSVGAEERPTLALRLQQYNLCTSYSNPSSGDTVTRDLVAATLKGRDSRSKIDRDGDARKLILNIN